MKKRKETRRAGAARKINSSCNAALLMAAAAVVASPAPAATKTYTGQTGLWSTSGNWNPSGVPGSADTVSLLAGTNTTVIVTYDGSVLAGNTGIASLTINSTSAGSISLLQSTNLLSISGSEIIGDTAMGSFTLNGGTHTIGGTLTIANTAVAGGTVTINGGILSALEIDPGASGNGTLIQSGGSISSTLFSVGRSSTSHGLYSLSGGTLSVSNFLYVGEAGNGTVNQNGGTAILNSLTLGLNGPAVGAYNLSSGASLTVTNTATIGFNGQGNFNQTGGKAAFSGGSGLVIGNSTGSGTVTLSGTGTLTAGLITLGANGRFNLNTGSTGALSYTTFNQTGGTFAASSNEFLGYSNSATYTQGGPTSLHTVGSALTIAGQGGGSGTYTLNAGLLSVGEIDPGSAGNGTFIQNGGTTTAGFVSVGRFLSGTGLVTFTGGSMSVSSSLYVGELGTGQFNQSGGTATAQSLLIGANVNANGAYSLSNNNASLSVSGVAQIGTAGQGTFNLTGGRAAFPGTLDIGAVGPGSGTVTISASGTMTAGTINLVSGQLNFGAVPIGNLTYNTFNQSGGTFAAAGTEAVGVTNAAVYNHSGGIHTVVGDLLLGSAATGSGTYAITGGVLTSSGLYLGGSATSSGGTGLFSASGNASVTVANTLKVWNPASHLTLGGNAVVSTGSMDLGGDISRLTFNSGTLNVTGAGGFVIDPAFPIATTFSLGANQTLNVTNDDYIGYIGNGAFTQNGGAHTVSRLIIGNSGAASGTYTLSGGTLSTLGTEYVGLDATGTFVQSGGTHTVGGAATLYVAYDFNSSGFYSLSGGRLSVPYETVTRNNGQGAFGQSNGTNSVAFDLKLTENGNGSSVYSFVGGVLNVGGSFFIVPTSSGGQGTYSQVGGIATIGNLLSLGSPTHNANGTATVILVGGKLTASSIVLYDDATFSLQTGSTNVLGYNSLVQYGGTFIATANETVGNTNAATYLQAGGTHTVSGVLNVGNANNTAAGVGTYTLQGGVLSIGGGLQVRAGSTFNLQGGTLLLPGAGNAINVATNATFRGFGVLTPGVPFSNDGTLSASGGNLTLVTSSFTNTGTVANAAGASLFIVGANINHTGSIIANAGGAVSFEVPITNAANRTITLNGGILTAPSITNAPGGAISGFGQISGDLVNNGTAVTFIGSTQIVGNLTNAASGSISISNAQLLITGATVNNGYMKSFGQHITFNGPYSGTGIYNSDPADNYFLSDVNLGAAAQILGSVGDTFHINGTYTNAGTYLNSGGTLTAQNIVNNGQFNQTAGQATMLALTGTGSTIIGGAGTSLASVTSFAQSSLTIADQGKFLVQHDPINRFTNTATTLSITGSGQLDLANHDLLTSTPSSTIRQYLVNGYNSSAWNGTGGISSTSAAADTNHARALGYADGNDGVVAGLAASQTLVKSTLYGDADLNGRVQAADFNLLSAHFNQRNATWDIGDFDYNGRVQAADFNLLSAHFNQRVTAGSPNVAAPSINSQATLSQGGLPALAVDYNATTGDVTLIAAVPLSILSLDLESNANNGTGDFIIGHWKKNTRTDANGATLPNILASTTFDLNQSGAPGVPYTLSGDYDLGQILPAGLTRQQVIDDLTDENDPTGLLNGPSTYGLPNGQTVPLGIFPIPEPSVLTLFGPVAIGLMNRRRRILP